MCIYQDSHWGVMWPRKIELTYVHSQKCDNYCEHFIHNNRGNKDLYWNTALPHCYSLINGLYNITTESIKPVLNVEQFGANSDLVIHTTDVQKVSFLLNQASTSLFLKKIIVSAWMYVCMCMSTPEAINNWWRDIDLIWLVEQVLQLLAIWQTLISINTHHGN